MFQARSRMSESGPNKTGKAVPKPKSALKIVKPVAPVIKKPTSTAPKTHAVKENPNISKPGMIKAPPSPAMPISKAAPKAAPKTAKAAPKPAAPKPTPKPAAPKSAPAPSTKKTTVPSTGKTTPKPGNTTSAANSTTQLNSLWNQANGYKTQLDALLKQGFTYDPTKDAAYLSLQATAQKNAGVASKAAMEDMNDRGILNSTVTSDRMGQIQQSAQDAVTAAIPGLSQNAYSHYMDQVNSLHGLWNDTVGQAQWKDSFNENKRQYDTSRADSNSHWNSEFNQRKQVDTWNHEDQAASNEIARLNYGLSEEDNMLAQQKYQDSYAGKDATQAAISNILQLKDSKSAYKYLSENANSFYKAGVNMNEVLTGISKRFPDVAKKAKTDKKLSFK